MKKHRITKMCVICDKPHSRMFGIETCSSGCSKKHKRLIIEATRHKYKVGAKIYQANYNKALSQLRKNHIKEFADIFNKIKEKR